MDYEARMEFLRTIPGVSFVSGGFFIVVFAVGGRLRDHLEPHDVF
jgi:hypothetical protein